MKFTPELASLHLLGLGLQLGMDLYLAVRDRYAPLPELRTTLPYKELMLAWPDTRYCVISWIE